jgi:hypothetical protein
VAIAAGQAAPPVAVGAGGDPGRAGSSSEARGAPPIPLRRPRRRRSAGLLPPLPVPVDVPDDAPGRVAYLCLDDPDGPRAAVLAGAGAADGGLTAGTVPVTAASDETTSGRNSRVGSAEVLLSWWGLVLVGAGLVLVFVLGLAATR